MTAYSGASGVAADAALSDVALRTRIGDIIAAAAREAGGAAAASAVDTVLQEIRRAADGGDLGATRKAAEAQLIASRRSWEAASKVLRALEELSTTQAAAAQAARSAAAGEAEIAVSDPVAAARAWAKLVAGALADGDLDSITRFAAEPLPFAERLPLVVDLIREGAAGLRGEDWSGTVLELLRFLAGAFEERGTGSAEERHAHAAVLVLIGRVELVDRDDPQAALRRYRAARSIAPDSALPLAARAAYHHRRREHGAGLAKAQSAVELAPERPEGYLALGLCAEGQGAPQAVGFYDQAIDRVWGRDDPHAALRTFFGTTSRTLMNRLAERADRESRPDLALRALDDPSALDPPDEPDEAQWRRQAREFELRARSLSALERPSEAVDALCDAADRCAWTQDIAGVRGHAEAALELDERSPRAHWLLADCLRILSSMDEPPFVNADDLADSLEHWELGAAAHSPGLGPWPLQVRAQIEEQRSRLPEEDRHERLWDAALHFERSLVLDPGDAWAYASLARILRGLNCLAAARQAVESALTRDPAEPTALEERVILVTGAGTVAEMDEAIAPFPPSPWLDAVRAFVLSRAGDPEHALELLNDLARRSPSLDLWQQELMAYCLSLLGRRDEEREVWERISAQRGRAETADLTTFGWAAWHLERVDEALEIAESLRGDPIDGAPAARLAGLCALEQGRIDVARAELHSGVQGSMWSEALLEFRDRNLPEAIRRVGPGPAAALCAEAEAWATSRLEELGARTAEDDLAVALTLEPRGEPSAEWLAAQAALARLATEQDREPEAARRYRLLDAFRAEFPEAAKGAHDAISALQFRGDGHLPTGDTAAAARTYDAALELARDGDPDDGLAFELHARLSVAHAELGDPGAAGEHLLAAAALAGGDAAAVAAVGITLLRDIDHFWAVMAGWGEARTGAAGERTDLVANALRQLGAFLEDALQGSAETVRRWPLAVPIRVELADELIPEDASEEGWPLLGRSMPAMQDRIEHDTGVRVPGTRLARSSALAAGEFVIWLDDAYTTRDFVPPGALYCLQAPAVLREAGIDAAAITPADDPLGQPACWVREEAATALEPSLRSALQPGPEYVVRRLEAILRDNLSAYLGLQHVEDLLEANREGREPLFRALTALPDDHSRLRFARVLRELVRDEVPIGAHAESGYVADLRDLLAVPLDAVLEAPSTLDAVAAMRRELKPRLPGNDPRFARFRIPEAWTAGATRDADGRLTWSPTPEAALEHLAAVRLIVQETDRPVALVTSDSELRPRVRAMIAIEFAEVPVLAIDELLDASAPLDVLKDPPRNGAGVRDALR